MLAVLASEANRPVHAERLVDLVWSGEQRPTGNSLQAHVSRWRKVLGAHRITYAPAGYTLSLGPDELDAAIFEDHARAAVALRGEGDLTASIARCEESLALWRGPAFADLDDDDCVRVRRVELESLRSEVELARFEMLVEVGDYDRAITDATPFAEADPWSEPIHRTLARAHYARGDQVTALQVLSDLDTRLRTDLGLDVSVATQLLREQILNQEPALDAALPEPREVIATAVDRMAERLEELPALTKRVMQAAALSGPDVDTAQIGRALEIDGHALADALAPALRAGLVVRTTNSVRFAAGRVQEAVANVVPAGEALELHRRLGEGLLMRRGGPDVEIRAAQHLAHAALIDSETALRSALLDHKLACDAIAQARYADAVLHARRALASADHVARDCDELDHAGLWLTLADALRWSADMKAALGAYATAASSSDAAPHVLVQAALQYEECSLQGRRHRDGSHDRSITFLERAVEVTAPDDPVRVDLLASLAQASMFSGLAERAANLGDRAVEEARKVGTPEVLARTLLRRLGAHDPVSGAKARRKLAEEAAQLSAAGDADELELEALCAWVPELMRCGQMAEVEDVIARVAHLADVEGNTMHRCKVPMWRAALALAHQQFAEAEVLIEDFRQVGEGDGYEDARRVHGFQSILLALGRGEPDDAAVILAGFDDDVAFEPWRASRLAVAHARGDIDAVQRELVPWSARRFALSHPFAGVQAFCAGLVAEAVAVHGDATARDRLADVLVPGSGQNLVLGAGAAMLKDASHLLALVRGQRQEEGCSNG